MSCVCHKLALSPYHRHAAGQALCLLRKTNYRDRETSGSLFRRAHISRNTIRPVADRESRLAVRKVSNSGHLFPGYPGDHTTRDEHFFSLFSGL